MTADDLRAWLRAHRLAPAEIETVLSGFDIDRPMYMQAFQPGDVLFQYVRRSHSGRPELRSGNWFCLTGASRDGLAILDGGVGRHLYRFVVRHAFNAPEGSAVDFARNEQKEIGGNGGATQIFIPADLIGHLAGCGPHTAW